MPPLTEKLLIDVNELSVWTGISVGTLYHWAAEGRLPCVRLSARCLRFRREAIIDWIERMSGQTSDGTTTELQGTRSHLKTESKKDLTNCKDSKERR